MEAPVSKPAVWDTQKVYKHHEQQHVAQGRPKYREGRRLRAVKVYTINLESRFLLVQGVPAIGLMSELVQLFALYGTIEEYRTLDEYPAEQFTEVFLIQFQKLTSAKTAKRHTDERSFFGGQLHVCYAPEYETVEETRLKLQDRRRYINRTVQKYVKEPVQQQDEPTSPRPNIPAPSSLLASSEIQEGPSNPVEDCGNSEYLGFPLLPLPPKEDVPNRFHSSQPLQRSEKAQVTEDNMGSLHKCIPHIATPKQNYGSPSVKETDLCRRKDTSPSVRFLPRTTHLESRKRKLECKTFFLNDMDKNETVIGPKLPELPKVDMEDHSLNVTANKIRQTMNTVGTVAEVKSVPARATTLKPRRRI